MEPHTPLLVSLQFFQDSLSPLSHPAHRERLTALGYLLQTELFPEQAQEARGIPLERYLYTLSVCRHLTDGDGLHEQNLSVLEEFVRQEVPSAQDKG